MESTGFESRGRNDSLSYQDTERSSLELPRVIARDKVRLNTMTRGHRHSDDISEDDAQNLCLTVLVPNWSFFRDGKITYLVGIAKYGAYE